MTDFAARMKGNVTVHLLDQRLLRGEQLALARAISIVENSANGAAEILAGVREHLGKAMLIGITGPPGVGKSTLINALITEFRRRKRRVSVLAVDPSSPLTGGAILGDRVRMSRHTNDPGVFVRSIASRGHLGGLFRTVWGVLQVMDAFGPDFIIIETVGAGQSEVEIADYAHTNIVVCAPGLGDDIQAIKAGILEIADILVVNKSDQPFAQSTVQQLAGMLSLRDPSVPVARIISATATNGDGIPELASALEELHGSASGNDRNMENGVKARRILARSAAHLLRERILTGSDPVVKSLCDRLKRREIDPPAAALELLSRLVIHEADATTGIDCFDR